MFLHKKQLLLPWFHKEITLQYLKVSVKENEQIHFIFKKTFMKLKSSVLITTLFLKKHL